LTNFTIKNELVNKLSVILMVVFSPITFSIWFMWCLIERETRIKSIKVGLLLYWVLLQFDWLYGHNYDEDMLRIFLKERGL
jgi:hypothetical protein